MKKHINKAKKFTDYTIPNVVLVSKFIEYFDVDLDDELTEVVKAHNEITCATLHEIGLKRVNDQYYICRGNEEEEGQQSAEGDTGARSSNATAEEFVMIPYLLPVDRGEPLSRFEQMVIGRFDTMAHEQKESLSFVLHVFNI